MMPFKGSPIDFTGKATPDLIQTLLSTSTMGSKGQRPEHLDAILQRVQSLAQQDLTQEFTGKQFALDQATGQSRGAPTDQSHKSEGGATAAMYSYGNDAISPGGVQMNPAQRDAMAYEDMMRQRDRQSQQDRMQAAEENARKQQLETYLSFLSDALLNARSGTGTKRFNYNIG